MNTSGGRSATVVRPTVLLDTGNRHGAITRRGPLRQSRPHEPGMPPQRPHDGISLSPLADLPPDDTAANTLNARSVFFEPHFGHSGDLGSLIVRTSLSNRWSHARQAYS
jgi:hypothetical protein